MNLEDLWAQIEAEQAWRLDELRFFQNQMNLITTEDKKDQFRRALILLLYAHFEGFCKFALTLYVNAINQENLRCTQVNHAIAAATLSDIFQALRDPNSKSPEFHSALPDDTQLHRFARDREFVIRSQNMMDREVLIPDDYVDTESNLKPVVLRKNLYKLGFAHDMFKDIEGYIHQLLNYRNKIAHGDLKDGISEEKYDKIRESSMNIMNEIKRSIMNALQNKDYLRSPT